jgi:hypothetical protein
MPLSVVTLLHPYIWCHDMDWIHLAQDKIQWRTLVNTVINLRIPKRRTVSWLVEDVPAAQEGVSALWSPSNEVRSSTHACSTSERECRVHMSHGPTAVFVTYFCSVFCHVPALGEAPCDEGVWKSGGISPCVLNFGTRRRSVVSLTLPPPRFLG